MNKQQTRRFGNIFVWRDSVALGDDVFAPHEKKVKSKTMKVLKVR